jgi:group I intron endonuclease
MKRYGIIYKATNTVNGKSYIGYTTQGFDVRKSQHLKESNSDSSLHFHRAIRFHGADAFTWEILEDNLTTKQSKAKEVYYIALYNTLNNGYNMTQGGEGVSGNPEVVAKRAKSKRNYYGVYTKDGDLVGTQKGLKQIAEMIGSTKGAVINGTRRGNLVNGYQVVKLDGETAPSKIAAKLSHTEIVSQHNRTRDYSHSEETKRKISASQKGINNVSPEARLKGSLKRMKQVVQYTLDGVKLNVYQGVKIAAKENDINYSTLKSALQRNNTAGGYVWKYAS